MIPHVQERWLPLLGKKRTRQSTKGKAWFAELDALLLRYAEPQREYHTLQHILHCLVELREAKDIVGFDIRALELAIWYHDAIYDPRSKTNEKDSADLARRVLTKHGFMADFVEEVCLMILSTAHGDQPEFERYPSKLMLDIDLSILGQSPERFDEYENQVRVEYGWVPEKEFRAKRAEILEHFLARDTIYQTLHFQRKYEAQARSNLERSIRKLMLA